MFPNYFNTCENCEEKKGGWTGFKANWVQGEASKQMSRTGTECPYAAEKSEELSSHIS